MLGVKEDGREGAMKGGGEGGRVQEEGWMEGGRGKMREGGNKGGREQVKGGRK